MYEITRQLLVKKFTISSNRSLDGVLEYLNSANMTEAGPMDLLEYNDDSDDDDGFTAYFFYSFSFFNLFSFDIFY